MFTNDLLKSKRILITGGGTGLGRAMAERFLQLGATVCNLGTQTRVVAKNLAAQLSAATGGHIEGFACDVRYPEDVDALIEEALGRRPARRAGKQYCRQFPGKDGRAVASEFDAVIGIVLKGTMDVTLPAYGRRWLKEQHKGVVLSITTTYADTGSAYVVPSTVAKAGVAALTRSLAVEWGGRGVRFVAIAPGAIRTEGAFRGCCPRPTGKGAARPQPAAPLSNSG